MYVCMYICMCVWHKRLPKWLVTILSGLHSLSCVCVCVCMYDTRGFQMDGHDLVRLALTQLCVCMYVCVCMCACMYVWQKRLPKWLVTISSGLHSLSCVYACMYVCIYVCVCDAYVHTYMHVYMHEYWLLSINTDKFMHIHIHIYIHIYTYIYTHIHMYSFTRKVLLYVCVQACMYVCMYVVPMYVWIL
jgi:hypothetical protein